MAYAAQTYPDVDRRTSPRVPTQRDVVFGQRTAPSRFDRTGLLQEGTVTDVSGTGMGVRTSRPAPVGASIDTEVQPRGDRHGSNPIISRGHVARVVQMGKGDYLMGVHLTPERPPTHALAAPIRVMRRAPRPAPKRTPAPPSRSDRRLWPVLVGLLLAAAFLVLLLLAPPDTWASGGRTTAHPAVARQTGMIAPDSTRDDRGPDRPHPGDGEGSELTQASAVHMASATGPVTGPQRRAPFAVPGRLTGMQDAAPGEATTPRSLPVTPTVMATLAPSDGAWGRGSRDGSVALIVDPEGVPDSLNGMGGPDAPLDDVRFEETLPPEVMAQSVALVVSRRDFTLTVLRRGRPVKRMPVGLGEGGSTPAGTFRIANKITRPDWYNRGDVVPAGDPRNPLGDQWMGLGTPEGATSYGLHPTNEPASIGAARSRGCVRLRPEDADTLFRLCPIGTPVHICR
ncbi:MAG: L,D-transpeptidase family protein [bacterium]|nr:L,D-transpeptidase family protein [bacterium]